MNETTRVPWLRILAESVAIVASILLAFALDEWRQSRIEARSEMTALRYLAAELDDAHAHIQTQLDIYAVIASATQTVADQMVRVGDGNSLEVENSSLASLLLDMTYDPPMGITEMLLASGQASLLRNPDLTVNLAAWPATIRDAVEEQTALWRLGDEQLEPLLHQSVDNLAPVYELLTVWEAKRNVVVEEADTSTLRSSIELWNLLYQRLTFLRGSQSELNAARVQLETIMAMVEQQLD